MKNLSMLDYMAIVGGLVNLCVVGLIIGYWLIG